MSMSRAGAKAKILFYHLEIYRLDIKTDTKNNKTTINHYLLTTLTISIMKKLFVMALAVATLASCSKVETINPGNQLKIGFDNAFVDNSTKALITTQNISKFMVYGTQNGAVIFEGNTVSKANGSWEYEGVRYWHRNSNYQFAAIAPAPHGLANMTFTNHMPATATYTLADSNIDGQSDLLYSGLVEKSVGADFPSGAAATVAFTFNHMLSKVSFDFQNNYNTGTNSYSILVKDLKIAAKANATINFATSQWTDHTGDLDLFFPINNGIKIEETRDGFSHESLIIPAPENTYTITGEAEIYYNNNKINTITFNQPIDIELKAGYNYNILCQISQEENQRILFSATVNNWGNGDGDNDGVEEDNDNYPLVHTPGDNI